MRISMATICLLKDLGDEDAESAYTNWLLINRFIKAPLKIAGYLINSRIYINPIY